MEMTTFEAVKEYLDLILNSTNDLPPSECDTPYVKNGYTVMGKATLDFRKGQRHCAIMLKRFIEDCEKEESEGEGNEKY